MPTGKFGLRRIAGGGVPIAPGPPPNPCDLAIGPSLFANDCHTAAGMFSWYQADKIVQAFETPIVSIADQSGAGHTATQSVCAGQTQDILHKHPVNIPTILGTPYDGSNTAGQFNLPAGFTQARGSLTVYCVCQYELSNPLSTPFIFTDNFILTSQSTHGGIAFSARPDRTVAGSFKVRLQASRAAGQTWLVETPAVCGWQVLAGVLDAPNSLMSIYRNGVLQASAAYAAEAATTDSAWKFLGVACGDFGNFEGNVTELMANNVAHNAALVASTSACLKARWGI